MDQVVFPGLVLCIFVDSEEPHALCDETRIQPFGRDAHRGAGFTVGCAHNSTNNTSPFRSLVRTVSSWKVGKVTSGRA